jgi:hypothetical protein
MHVTCKRPVVVPGELGNAGLHSGERVITYKYEVTTGPYVMAWADDGDLGAVKKGRRVAWS